MEAAEIDRRIDQTVIDIFIRTGSELLIDSGFADKSGR